MIDPEIQRYIDGQISKAQMDAKYGVTNAVYHEHNGIDSPYLSAVNVIGLTGGTGVSVTKGANTVTITSSTSAIPAGVVMPFGGTSAAVPSGYLLCDGTSYLRADYANLFAAIGTIYGSADGTHFNVPDMRGATAVGYKSADTYFGTFGVLVGESTHTLTTGEMPSHTHGLTAVWGNGGTFAYPYLQGQGNAYTPVNPYPTDAAGGGGAHYNVQPSLIMSYIIKT